MRAWVSLAALGLLGGCMGERPAPDASGRACVAARAQAFIGRVATPDLAEVARKATSAAVVRTIRPGVMVTMDYRADRLNVTVDAKGLVASIRCG